jgi:uncharacterized protein (DUF924 family)
VNGVDPAAPPEPAWVDEVLAFWFESLGEAQWFARDAALDARIRARFGELHAALATGAEPEPATVREALATIVVLDQFSRNLFRGDARAFAADARARRLAGDLVARGEDAALRPAERLHVYLPFEHGEALEDQQRAVALVAALGNPEWTRYAEAHRAIIERFGRFPHRNAVLGRESTPEEIAAMAQPMGSF